jgi:hypothetical protein
MFRKGGSTGEGITSGLAPRQGYQGLKPIEQLRKDYFGSEALQMRYDNVEDYVDFVVSQGGSQRVKKIPDLSNVNLKDMNMQQIKDLADSMAYKAPPMPADTSLRDFKIDFGLDLVGRTPGANIFQTAALAAKEPFANFRSSKASYNQALQDRAVNKYNSQTGMFETLLGAQADIFGSEGGSKTFAKQANDAEIQALMTKLFELDAAQKTDQALTDEEYAQQQAILMQRLQGYTGKNPAVTSLFGNKEQADIVIQGIQNDITNSETVIKVMGPHGS